MNVGFTPPPYPQDRLNEIRQETIDKGLEVIDLSIGTPYDPAPDMGNFNGDALATTRGYPASIGSNMLREAASSWMERRFGVQIEPSAIASCVGSKEFVASVAGFLRLRTPNRSTVLYPAISYPTYEMGALLGNCKPIAVPLSEDGELNLAGIPEAILEDTLCVWINSPSNPTGKLSSGAQLVELAREYDFLVISDECYIEYTFDGPPRTVLAHGTGNVLALHSLSKRSNFAGGRVGFYAGDSQIVRYLSEVRKHAGLMIPGPMQSFGAALLMDQTHVDHQRELYRTRLEILLDIVRKLGYEADFPEGGFYIWLHAKGYQLSGFELARQIALSTGIIGSPGEFYGKASIDYLRIAAVTSTEKLLAVSARL